jgi:hypothetical protein
VQAPFFLAEVLMFRFMQRPFPFMSFDAEALA